MAENKNKTQSKQPEPEQVVREAVREAESDGDRFPVDRLISEGENFLGHPSHVVAGALHAVNRKELTLDEAREAVDAWLSTPVPQEG